VRGSIAAKRVGQTFCRLTTLRANFRSKRDLSTFERSVTSILLPLLTCLKLLAVLVTAGGWEMIPIVTPAMVERIYILVKSGRCGL
jgi:hypothetical protein